jgi:uncharacterized protein YfaS (alpha-2-macroglobulin family)
MEIVNGTTTTDSEGKFSISFQALPDQTVSKSTKPVFSYTVYADVVDITGETHSAQQSVSAGYIALDAGITVPSNISKQKPGELTLRTQNLNGGFEPAQGNIRIIPLQAPDRVFRDRRWQQPDKHVMKQAEFYKEFPNDIYAAENKFENWEKGNPVMETAFNTAKAKTISLEKLKNVSAGRYLVEMKTEDKYGEEILVTEYIMLTDEASGRPAVPAVMLESTDKASAEPGESVTLSLRSSEKDFWMMYLMEKNGKVMERKMIRITKGQEKIVIPVSEEYRGGFSLTFAGVRHNQFHSWQHRISVPWSNKDLKMEWMTFRSKLKPGQEEEWKLKITGPKGDAVAAEMVAAMYDASLDAFRSNSYGLNLYPNHYPQRYWRGNDGYGTVSSSLAENDWNPYYGYSIQGYDQLNWFGFYFGAGRYGYQVYDDFGGEAEMAMDEMVVAAPKMMKNGQGREKMEMDSDGVADMQDAPVAMAAESAPPPPGGEIPEPEPDLGEVAVRTNLNETAFFFPHLETNSAGEVIFSFTMPEALTRWNFLALAHTKDLEIGTLTGQTLTQKELMVMPNPPRFVRVGDRMTFTAKVSNLAEEDLSGKAELRLMNAITGDPVEQLFGLTNASIPFAAKQGQSDLLKWEISIPDNVQALTYQVVASSGTFSDGEEGALPVLLNRMLVTETMPLPVRGKETKEFTFAKLVESGSSSTLRHQKLTLEFTSNPAWYAVQALPYIMEFPYECSEQVFSRFYANALGTHIANSSPNIKRVFDQWREQAKSDNDAKEALLSNLETNQDLKSVLLEETPWVLNAQSETERKKRVGLLFDLNKMSDELARNKAKLLKMQNGNGSWPWFPGMHESRYITQLIVTGMGHLDKLGVTIATGDPEVAGMIANAIPYLDREIENDYQNLLRYKADMDKDHLGSTQVQYLYLRSFYPDIPQTRGTEKAFAYYFDQAIKYWNDKGMYMQGMIALSLHRYSETKVAKEVVASIKENAVYHDELGMYWKYNSGYFWFEAPIETQALLIEAFHDVTGDTESVENMKIWLLKQKQTQDWKTTRATVEACNALLLTGENLLESNKLVEIEMDGIKIDPYAREDARVEAGTGYFKTAWVRDEIKPGMGKITVKKEDSGVAWGALYWQYFEQLDKITFAQTPLNIRKELFREKNTATGPVLEPITEASMLKQGDKVVVRVELRVDRDMEYVHMKDMRAAGFEPVNVFSGYRYQGGLGYYESTKDAATHFFFDYLSKGTYVFEYPLRATHAGDFSNGITTIQCMYAPEYTSHSAGIRVGIE